MLPAVQVVMLDRTFLAPPITITTEPELEHNELPLKRRRIRWNVELNGCFCGSVLDSAAGVPVIKLNSNERGVQGCETQWVRKIFIGHQSIFINYINYS